MGQVINRRRSMGGASANPYADMYLTIESTSDNNRIGWSCQGGFTKQISYSTDDGATWTSATSSDYGTLLTTLNTGDKILVKGNNSTYGGMEPWDEYNRFGSDNTFIVYGNIMSMIYGDNFAGATSFVPGSAFVFPRLFEYSFVESAENLVLPATTLVDGCYMGMFNNCYSLTTTPALPATVLAEGCYSGMFYYCSSLTSAPNLRATVLAGWCYNSMFQYCSSLTTAPALPATTLADGCYDWMFAGCTSLTTAPELPATTLTEYCYEDMFNGCTNLNYVKMLATDISATDCLNYWLYDVAASGTFVKDASMTTLPSGESGIPNGWTVEDYSE